MTRNRDLWEKDLWEKAFELGYFIHRDRFLATQILVEAEDRWETVAARQRKRRFYVLGRRGPGQARRDKVILERAPLLQYLVYVESELRELEQERRDGIRLTDGDRIVRYIKHLVRATLDHHAFYVCIGIGRLLYRYSTSELLRLYDVLTQDAERVQSHDYFRSRKKFLIDEMLRRFGSTVRLRVLARGEKNFESRVRSTDLSPLVEEALSLFTPWKTACSIPKEFDPTLDVVPELRFQGSDPDQEHAYEHRRMHAVLHPPCFAGLVGALGFEAPEARLAVPMFFADSNANTGGDSGPDDVGRRAAPLTDAELQQIEEELERRNDRRDLWKLRLLSVRVGQEDIGKINLLETDRAQFHLPAGTSVVEVWGEHVDGPVRLATFLPGWWRSRHLSGSEGELNAVVELSNGREIRFVVPSTSPGSESAGDNESAAATMLEIRYRETHPFRALTLWGVRLWHGSHVSPSLKRRRATVFATVCAIALSAALVHFFTLPEKWESLTTHHPTRSEPGAVSSDSMDVSSEPKRSPLDSEGVSAEPEIAPSESGEPPPKSLDNLPQRTSIDIPLRDPVRGGSEGSAVLTISEVKILYIGPLGSEAGFRALRQGLVEHLGGGDRFRLAAERVAADAVLQFCDEDGSSGLSGSPTHSPLVLVNRKGEILWREDFQDPVADETVRAQQVAASLMVSARQSL